MIEEEKDKERRRCNVLVYNLEDTGINSEETHKADTAFIDKLTNVVCKLNMSNIKTFYRLGKRENKVRPLLISFQMIADKNLFVENLKNLSKADDILKKVSVCHDLTPKDRDKCKELVKEAKMKQQAEKGEYIFRVRRNPGEMKVVKIKRRNV